MDKLVINLDVYQNISKGGKIFNIIFGFAAVLLSSWVIYRRIAAGQEFWDYFIFLILLILGLYMILFTFGVFYRISRRYVILDNNGVEYKLSQFYPSKKYEWEELRKVEIKTLRINFHKVSGSSSIMKLGELFYTDIKKLKQALASCCTEKGIEWSDTTVESDLEYLAEKERSVVS